MDLRTRRERLELSQAEVAAAAGVDQTLVSHLELGKSGPATGLRFSTLTGLASALRWSVDDVTRAIDKARRARVARERVRTSQAEVA
jgi:predicted transcriptional regulator